jgi:hypothetical protein
MELQKLNTNEICMATSTRLQYVCFHPQLLFLQQLLCLLFALCSQDLMQFPDRYKWYEPSFAAEDMPDWNPGHFLSNQQVHVVSAEMLQVVIRSASTMQQQQQQQHQTGQTCL